MFRTHTLVASFTFHNDVLVRYYVPTLWGKLRGLATKWTVSQCNGVHGQWTFNGTQSGSDEVQVTYDAPAYAETLLIKYSFTLDWKGDVSVELHLSDPVPVTTHCIVRKDGSSTGWTTQELDDDEVETLELPAV